VSPLLSRRAPADVAPRRHAVDEATLRAAEGLLREVREGGEPALLALAERFGDWRPGRPHLFGPAALAEAFAALPPDERGLLERTARRVRTFAEAQAAAFRPARVPVPGGEAGHDLVPVERAACYAPGGRFPLPSSVLMTAVTARAAGVREVWVASPRPAPVTLAAAHVAGADGLLGIGGAQAVGAFAYGVGGVPAADVIVGPGNRWVTAAKQLVAGRVGIDMLAGPSELVVVADRDADPHTVAADLLAQAEHDPDALAVLITDHEPLLADVEAALAEQLATLATAATARASLANGYAVLVGGRDEALALVDRIGPEHLELAVAAAAELAPRVRNAGAIFLGRAAAEVLGDYGAGPNHVLPTGGTARFSGGLSVLTFLRLRTWLAIDRPAEAAALVADAAALARLEGLEAHARAARRRLPDGGA
jgi:histidinol dehydrogenase